MIGVLTVIALTPMMMSGSTSARLCGTLPDNLTNGTTADATQVMANCNARLSCINDDGAVNNGTIGQGGNCDISTILTSVQPDGVRLWLDAGLNQFCTSHQPDDPDDDGRPAACGPRGEGCAAAGEDRPGRAASAGRRQGRPVSTPCVSAPLCSP